MTHLDEIAQLKALIEKQQKQLNEQQHELDVQAKESSKKDDIIKRQQLQIDAMIQALLHAQKKRFGRSSEVTNGCEGQYNLFENYQDLAAELLKEQTKITVPAHTRTPRQPGVRAEMLAYLPKEIEEYEIEADDTCSICNGKLKVIGKEVVRTEVDFIPAKLIVKQIVRQVGKCTICGTQESDNPKDHFQKAAVPSKLLSHSIATASLVSQVMYQKFCMGVPFNRQERDFHRMGLILPRASMAHWTIRCSDEWLLPIYELMHKKLCECEVLHMDETRIQVNKEKNRKPSTNSFMWVMQSGLSEDIKATYFHYSPTRNTQIAKMLLEDFHGYLTTDAYSVYQCLDGVKNNLCWAHVRRYYVESIPLDSKGKEIPGSKGAEGRGYIDLLFNLERKIKDLPYDEKKIKRQESARAILDAFWAWVEETSAKYTTNEKLTTALNYSTNQRQYLETFLEDGRLDISNNLCESHIKPFATARRAWLFADTPKGARANAIMYTLVESARANDLNVYEYLKYLLSEMPNIDFQNQPELLEPYLPWS